MDSKALLVNLRAAFDSNDVAIKNVMLRKAYDDIAALGRGQPVAVKPLDWDERSGAYYADTALGEAYIDLDGDGFYVIENGRKHSDFATVEAAQAFVQKNHDRWVCDWLVTPPAPAPAHRRRRSQTLHQGRMTMDSTKALKPCPFCGGDAELDYSRHFRAMSSRNLEKAVAIYCLQCSADMMLCRSDHREYDAEQLADILTENWNRRAALSAQREAAQPVAEGWRPIATCPIADNLVVMGWGEYRERDGFSPAFMRYYKSVGGWSVNAMPFYPTHWMPLPTSPNAASQDGGDN